MAGRQCADGGTLRLTGTVDLPGAARDRAQRHEIRQTFRMAGSSDGEIRQVAIWSDVSERLRQARTARGISVRALAGRIGVSPSLISQIETAKVRPSVNTLYALAVELELSVDGLMFGPTRDEAAPQDAPAPNPAPQVQRAGGRASVELAPGARWERLTRVSEPGVDFLRLVYAPGSSSVPAGTPHRHTGREWGYLVSGTLHVEVAGERFELQAGDSITFASTDVHRLSNPGDVPARAIWFVLGRHYTEAPDGGTSQESTAPEGGVTDVT